MHADGRADFSDLAWTARKCDGTQAYCDSKLHDTMLAFAVARRWANVLSNAVDPGWIATKMGGANAPGDLESGAATQVWLAESEEPAAKFSGSLFHRHKPVSASSDARNEDLQDELLERLAAFTGVSFAA